MDMCCEKNGSFEISRYKNLIILLILLSYVTIQSFAVTAPFFPLDDPHELALCQSMDSWWQVLGKDAFNLFRPIKNLLFVVFRGLMPYGTVYCRSLAIVIGVMSFFPVLGLMRRILKQDNSVLMASAMWLLAPTLVSTTAWLSCVNIQIMCGAAAFALLFHDLSYRDGRIQKVFVFLSACLLFVALVSYESAIAVGPAIVCFDYFLRAERFRKRTTWEIYGIYAAVTAVYLLLRHIVGGTTVLNGNIMGVSRLELCFASAYLTCLHFRVWLLPFGQMAPIGGYSPGCVSIFTLVGCWLLIGGWIALSFYLRKRSPVCAFGLAFALLTFLPVSNVLGFGNGPFGDYYLGVPSIGFVLTLTVMIMKLLKVQGPWRFCACSLVGLFLSVRVLAGIEAGHWAFLWSDGIAAYTSGTKAQPWALINWRLLASELVKRGRYEEALMACDTVEPLVKEYPDMMARLWITRTMCALIHDKDPNKALRNLEQVENCLRNYKASNFVAHWSSENIRQQVAEIRRSCNFIRGCVYDDLLNDNKSAEREYVAAMPMKWDIDTPRTADRLARLWAIRGNLVDAVALWERALTYVPNDESIRYNIALARKNMTEKKWLPPK